MSDIATTSAGPPGLYPWRRYWALRDGSIDLSDGGFLVDPESDRGRYSAQKLYTLGDLQHYRALALLGEPGIGKSVTLNAEFAAMQQDAGARGGQRYIDLRSFSSDVLLHNRVFGSPDFLAWEAGDSDLVLYLDSLDEALLRIDTIASFLADELPQHPTQRLSVRIACRTFVWPHAPLETALRAIWGEASVGVFELAPLRRNDVADAARIRGIDPERFIAEVQKANAVPFAIKPLTLNLLLRLFERDGALPARQLALYTEGCLSLCEEHSANRLGARRHGGLNGQQRYRLAGRVAAVTMLANRYAVWTDPATDGRPAEDVTLSELAIGTEAGDFQPFDASDDNLREVLDTGLFSSRGPARIGWAHQSYAEFLAADYLVSKRTSPENIMKVLCHPNGGLVPQLWMVAAWAASRNPDLRQRLTEREPFTLLRGDLLSWTADDLAALTEALLTAFQEQRAHDFAWGIANEYRKLAHPGLAAQVRPFIIDKTRNVIARRAALMIARACAVREVGADVLAVALDPTDDSSLRAQAVSAVETCADEAIRLQLLPLARTQLGPDPLQDIKGNALRLLWPRHITSADLFGLLTPPDDGHIGAYVMFVTRELPESLTGDDFVPALQWITAYARGAAVTGPIQPRNVCDSILTRAWAHSGSPAVMQAVTAYVKTVFQRFHQLFMSAMHREDEDFKERVCADVELRREFLLTVLGGAPLRSHEGFLYRRAGFLQKDDLGWLLSICPMGSAPEAGLNTESLVTLISAVFDPWESADLELVYDIAMAWAPLHQRYTGLLDGVPLDSAEAAQLKSHHEATIELDRGKPPLLDPPPAERVRRDIERFEAGEIDAWWHLNINLSLTPTSTHFDHLELNIPKMPGWATASEEARERIVRAARKFLEDAVPLIDTWLGTSSYKFSDRSAYRAFFLLRELDPTTYAGLSPEIWRKWAAVIVAVQKDTGGDDGKVHEHILGEAVRKAPSEAADTIRRLIRLERRRSRRQQQANAISSFFLLRELRDAWTVAELQQVVFAELNNRNNSPAQFESLLDPLLQSGFAPAQALVRGMLRAPSRATTARRRYMLAAAGGWLLTDSRNAWPQIWRWIEADPQFGSELFQELGRSFGAETPFYSRLDEAQAGQLYLWLEQSFPARDDARNQRLGRASWVGPAEMVAHLRDGVLRDLVNRGTEESVAALRRVIAQLPDRPWLVYQLLEAEQTMRIRTWQPLMPHEVIAVTASAEVKLVQSARQLEEILVRTLRKYERHLHGEQTPVRALWDRQANGSLRPVDEDALSDHVRLFLKHELVDSGIVANREVEIGRVPGARLGRRTDIKVEALSKSDAGRYNVIAAVIETKGCWNAELLTAMTTQLVNDYMVTLATPAGIYLVGWFDKPKWDAGDARRARTPDLTFKEIQSALDAQAAAQPAAFIVEAVVLGCHAP